MSIVDHDWGIGVIGLSQYDPGAHNSRLDPFASLIGIVDHLPKLVDLGKSDTDPPSSAFGAQPSLQQDVCRFWRDPVLQDRAYHKQRS